MIRRANTDNFSHTKQSGLRMDRPMYKALLSLLLLCGGQLALADSLKPFTSDGCSDFPDGTPSQQTLWLDCCIRHDLAYWKGGTQDERFAADQLLQQCVAQVGEPEIASLMLAGVRVGGSPYYPTSFRWGYGWSYLRGYQALTDAEKTQVKHQLKRLEHLIQTLSKELDSTKD